VEDEIGGDGDDGEEDEIVEIAASLLARSDFRAGVRKVVLQSFPRFGVCRKKIQCINETTIRYLIQVSKILQEIK
jgi:hypothetical protein